jgi:hypothetical protein
MAWWLGPVWVALAVSVPPVEFAWSADALLLEATL